MASELLEKSSDRFSGTKMIFLILLPPGARIENLAGTGIVGSSA
jgi:hypothetical protein